VLVVTRKYGQKIIIGDNIELTILDIKGDQVRIGINAPKNIPILRQEVYMEITSANKEAATIYSDGMIQQLTKKLKDEKKK
jgi:carbon storage regulator